MQFKPIIIIALLSITGFYACQHDILNTSLVNNADPTLVAAPPVGGGSTTNTASDTVCFNTDVLPLYVSYCGSSGCHDANS